MDNIELGVLWNRLIAITDELQSSLVRASFSTTVRESYDLSCLLFDSDGRNIAQGTYSIPSFTGTAPLTLRHILQCFPPETLEPGDVLATNDPWMGTGHLFDINVVRPVFRSGKIIGYCMSITHLPDIGGAGWAATAAEIFEEGLQLPIFKLMKGGVRNEELVNLISANVRTPDQVIGDLMANVACTAVGARLLAELCEEYNIEDIGEVSSAIIAKSEAAIRQEIGNIRDGIYRNAVRIEGREEDVKLECAVRIDGEKADVSFEGTSSAVHAGINVPICYTRAMALYALKCLTVPDIPNNGGFAGPITVTAPEGSILNAMRPFPTAARHTIGHFVSPLIFGALADALPDRVQADPGMTNAMNMFGMHRDGTPMSNIYFCAGGMGAMDGKDGNSATPSPSNMSNVPVELWESLSSLTIETKRLLPDSGGAGKFRGGLGQEIVIVNSSGNPINLSLMAGRTEFAAQGMYGGLPGRCRKFWINESPVRSKTATSLHPVIDCELMRREVAGMVILLNAIGVGYRPISMPA